MTWSAEVSAILGDSGGGRGFVRAARALSYSAGISRATRRLRRVGDGSGGRARRASAVPWRDGAPASPRGPAFRATAGAGIWLVFVVAFVAVMRGLQPHTFWQIISGLLAAVGFVAFCLADLARAEVRYLPRWGWVLACVLSIPLGGIMYLSVGRSRWRGPLCRTALLVEREHPLVVADDLHDAAGACAGDGHALAADHDVGVHGRTIEPEFVPLLVAVLAVSRTPEPGCTFAPTRTARSAKRSRRSLPVTVGRLGHNRHARGVLPISCLRRSRSAR